MEINAGQLGQRLFRGFARRGTTVFPGLRERCRDRFARQHLLQPCTRIGERLAYDFDFAVTRGADLCLVVLLGIDQPGLPDEEGAENPQQHRADQHCISAQPDVFGTLPSRRRRRNTLGHRCGTFEFGVG